MSYFLSHGYIKDQKKIKIDLDLSNYATKYGLKNGTGVNTLLFPKNDNLASLKATIIKLNVDELKNIPRGWTVWKLKQIN